MCRQMTEGAAVGVWREQLIDICEGRTIKIVAHFEIPMLSVLLFIYCMLKQQETTYHQV
jgi:hypothetical protein